MEPFQIIQNDLGCTLGPFSLCKASKSVSMSYKKRGEKRLSNQISLIQFIQQVAVCDVGHVLIDKMFDTFPDCFGSRLLSQSIFQKPIMNLQSCQNSSEVT